MSLQIKNEFIQESIRQGADYLANLLAAQPDLVHGRTSFGSTFLMLAARDARVDAVKTLLRAKSEVDATDCARWSALMRASASADLDTVQALLEGGADAALRDRRGLTALHIACKRGSPEVVRALAERSPDILRLRAGWIVRDTPLDAAAREGRSRVVEGLLDADPTLATQEALYAAVESGSVFSARMLLRHGAKPGAAMLRGSHREMRTLLLAAHEQAGLGVEASDVAALCKHGDSVALRRALEASPRATREKLGCGRYLLTRTLGLRAVSEETRLELISVMLEADPECLRLQPEALALSLENNDVLVVCALLQSRYSVELVSKLQPEALLAALRTSHSLLRALLEFDPSLAKRRHGPETLLTAAIKSSSSKSGDSYRLLQTVKLLLRFGARPGARNAEGKTALSLAVELEEPNLSVLKELVAQSGARDIDLFDRQGLTPLLRACRRGCWDAASLLVRRGGSLELCTQRRKYDRVPRLTAVLRGADGLAEDAARAITRYAWPLGDENALHLCAKDAFSVGFLREALRADANVALRCRDRAGRTPLIAAIHANNHGVVEAMLDHDRREAGCSGVDGLTPLMVAVSQLRDSRIPRALLHSDFRIASLRNSAGRTALDIARRSAPSRNHPRSKDWAKLCWLLESVAELEPRLLHVIVGALACEVVSVLSRRGLTQRQAAPAIGGE